MAACLALLMPLLIAGCVSLERRMLFYPTHRPPEGVGALAPWLHDGATIGWSRCVTAPTNVWLLLHGNAGQAADRAYALPCFAADDAVYILEYPGYGGRGGTPSKKSFNRAAGEAYQLLRATYPATPLCVAAESIGSGPAASLASQHPPPDKIVLVVPFERLACVAKDRLPGWLVDLALVDNWNNQKALAGYTRPLEIVGAAQDDVIPVRHARALADSLPGATFILLPGGHNDWADAQKVRFRYP